MSRWTIEPNSFQVIRVYAEPEGTVDICYHGSTVWLEIQAETGLSFHRQSEIDAFIKHLQKARECLEHT